MDRSNDFKKIIKSIDGYIHTETPRHLLVSGDSLPILRSFPDQCVSVILTDPPYHVTQKSNIYGDTRFKRDHDYLDWLCEYATEWKRILKNNGSLYCFCDPSMSARVEVLLSHEFNILANIVWTKPNDPGYDGWKGKMKKEALRQWYPHSERIVFAEPAMDNNLFRSPFASLLREARQTAGLSQHELTEMTGAYGKVNHGGAVSNWEAGRNSPSREQYARICEAIMSTGIVSSMPPYEDAIRPFNMDKHREFTDIWTFPSVKQYNGKHPAEKPLDLLLHAIIASSYEDDIILDCFAGSGNTALAAASCNRRSISIEIDDKWVATICNRLKTLQESGNTKDAVLSSNHRLSAKGAIQGDIFSS
jgi:site-specific DNA-methyltransferase (adenine-specific)